VVGCMKLVHVDMSSNQGIAMNVNNGPRVCNPGIFLPRSMEVDMVLLDGG